MTRSIWKGPFCEISTHKTKIWSRRSMILPKFLGKQFVVYNGKSFIAVKIIEDMVGHKFGEFANTRKKAIHKKKIQNKKRK
jgi:small subunit ribosomal protein S19